MHNKPGLLVAAMTMALVSHAWASSPVTQADALADIAKVNAADGQELRQIIRSVNTEYGTRQHFTSSAMNAAQATGDAAAQAAGNQYDAAMQQSLSGAADHRQGDEASAVAPAAQAAGNSESGPIANHNALGNAYEQDASNAENYVCTATNKKGQCTAGYWNCNSVCEAYRADAQQQFQLAATDRQQQSQMYAQSSALQAQGDQQQSKGKQLDGEASANENSAYNGNVNGSEQAGELEQQGQTLIVQNAKTSMDNELTNIRRSLKVANENVPYTLPDIPAQSAATLTAAVRSQVNALQAKATQLADTAMQESKAAGEAYRQWKAYLQAEKQAQQQARQDEAKAAAAPTASSRAAWASAAAAMNAKAQQDARDAAQQKSIYHQQKQLAKTHTEASEQLAAQEVQVAKGAVENAASQQIAPYLH